MILSVCLNPALQRTLIFHHIQPGHVNRAREVHLSAGGKGVNVSRVVCQLGGEVTLLCILGGDTGEQVRLYLEHDGIPFTSINTFHPTRFCQTLIDTSSAEQTELVEESLPVSPNTVQHTFLLFQEQVRQSRIVVLSGTAPAGFPDTIYADYIRAAKHIGVPTIVDAAEPFVMHALKAQPFLIKPNRMELEHIFNQSLNTSESIFSVMKKLVHVGAGAVLMTDQAEDAWLFFENNLYRLQFPRLNGVNAIGSGDAITGGIAHGWMIHHDLMESVRLGMACGCANVLTPLAGHVEKDAVYRLAEKILIEKVI